MQGLNETGIDCGAVCQPCQSTAPLPVCSDGVRGEHETGIGCGGPCPGYAAYPDCAIARRRTGSRPTSAAQPRRAYGVANQDESDTDCGGAKCAHCANGLKCDQASDCVSNLCQSNFSFETAVVARYILIKLTAPGTKWWSIGDADGEAVASTGQSDGLAGLGVICPA